MKKSTKLLSLLLALILSLSLATTGFAANSADTAAEEVTPYTVPADVEGKVVILHTNDTHGHDVAVEGKTVGTAGVAALKKAFEEAGADVYLFSAGDFSQGTTLVSLDKGASAVAFMNAAGYDAASLGNHEFDYKMDALKANAESAEFSILAANIVETDSGKPLFGDHVVYETAIGKVGVFGLDTPETMTKAHPDNVKGLNFYQGDELVKCAQAQVDALKAEGCVYIIALSHLGTDPESEPNRSTDVFAKVTGVDLVVDGHSHTEINGGEKAGTALVVSTGEYLNNVGVVITDGKTTTARLVSAAEWTKVDEDVAKVIDARNEVVTAELSKTFATTEVLLNGERAPGNRTQETNLGDFAADAILWGAKQALGEDKVDIALTNGGGIRASIEVGDITMNTMKTVFPFGNEVATIDVTGAELLEALEAATCSTPTAIGAFPQVAGITFTIDTTVAYENGEQYSNSTYYAPAKPGTRVKDVTVNGEALDLEATYTLATNDFTAAGGDTYGVFLGKSIYKTGVALEDALVNYTREVLGNKVTADKYGKPAGRITVKYSDVSAEEWYAEAIHFVTEEGIMGGASTEKFDTEGTVDRATAMTVLARMAGEDTTGGATWYEKAQTWCVENNISNGKDPSAAVTRQELAAMLYRYEKNVNEGGYAEGEWTYDTTAYPDANEVESWAQEAITWTTSNGIITGKSGSLAPEDLITRAEVATMLMRFASLDEKAE